MAGDKFSGFRDKLAENILIFIYIFTKKTNLVDIKSNKPIII